MISNKSIQLIIILVALIRFAHSKWVPVWADEFNGNELNYTNWGHEEGLFIQLI